MFQAEDLISGSRRLGGVSPDTARSDSAASRLSLDPVPTHRGRLEQHDYPEWEGGVNKMYHGIRE